MMGSRPDDDPVEGLGRLKAGFVVLVGLSGGMIAVQGGASLLVVALSIVGGLLVGGALLWYLLWVVQ